MLTHSSIELTSSSDTYEELVGAVESRMVEVLSVCEADSKVRSEAVRAAAYHLSSGGHRVRARLALHAGLSVGLSPGDSVTIAATAELLHNASLVHDDLQDRDRLRRGVATVWSLFGEEVAVCTGDLLLSSAYGALSSFSSAQVMPALLSLVHSRTAMAIQGQCSDLSLEGREGSNIATYEKIVIAKSGALLSLPIELALIGSGRSEWAGEARRAAESLSIGYQIVDDLDDVEGDAGASDLPASLNVILLLQAAGHRGEAREVARSIGIRRLEAAAELASLLPHGSGELLSELALHLSSRLEDRRGSRLEVR
jgi:geranylgeranyl pyrophosphate synthase